MASNNRHGKRNQGSRSRRWRLRRPLETSNVSDSTGFEVVSPRSIPLAARALSNYHVTTTTTAKEEEVEPKEDQTEEANKTAESSSKWSPADDGVLHISDKIDEKKVDDQIDRVLYGDGETGQGRRRLPVFVEITKEAQDSAP